jgi:transposase-like protein
VRAGLEGEAAELMLAVARDSDGSQSIVALQSGTRGSDVDWQRFVDGLRVRGLVAPRLVVAAGDLALWPALERAGWKLGKQACWNHAIETLVDDLPAHRRRRAAALLRRMSRAPSRTASKRMANAFVRAYRKRHADVTQRLEAAWPELTSFYELPEEHWTDLQSVDLVRARLDEWRLLATNAKPQVVTPRAAAILWRLLAGPVNQGAVVAEPTIAEASSTGAVSA